MLIDFDAINTIYITHTHTYIYIHNITKMLIFIGKGRKPRQTEGTCCYNCSSSLFVMYFFVLLWCMQDDVILLVVGDIVDLDRFWDQNEKSWVVRLLVFMGCWLQPWYYFSSLLVVIQIRWWVMYVFGKTPAHNYTISWYKYMNIEIFEFLSCRLLPVAVTAGICGSELCLRISLGCLDQIIPQPSSNLMCQGTFWF